MEKKARFGARSETKEISEWLVVQSATTSEPAKYPMMDYGFLHPSSNTKQSIMKNMTVQAAEQLDMCAYVHWDNYSQEPAMERTVAAYAHTAIHGIFSPVQPAVPLVVAEDIVTFTETTRWFTKDHPKDVAKHINGLKPGSNVFVYKIHDVPFADVEAMAAALDSNVVLMGHRELISMMRAHFGIKAGASKLVQAHPS